MIIVLVGHTCYMNSVIQCLYGVQPFISDLKEFNSCLDIDDTQRGNNGEPIEPMKILRAFTNLLNHKELGQEGKVMLNAVKHLNLTFSEV